MTAGVQRAAFGELPDGSPIELFTLTNIRGMVVRVTNYGTIITEIHVPDREGRLGDVVLGFDNLDAYLQGHPYFGGTVGRVANRIADAAFELDGVRYQLTRNSGRHHLHGGTTGFDQARWQATTIHGPVAGVRFRHASPDGDQGYPGRLDVTVSMTLDDENVLAIEYLAGSNRATPVALTNHSYFNLACGGDVLQHELQLHASAYTPTDHDLIPLGNLAAVEGTALDFREARTIGSRIGEVDGPLPGYDHNYVLGRDRAAGSWSARLRDPDSGRVLTMVTTEPCLQCYTGNALDGALMGKYGMRYQRHAAMCLEPQRFPDALHHEAFASNVLRPGGEYRQVTRYCFGID
jgi:aldose 1-epimerase